MATVNSALFVRRPRVLSDLIGPHHAENRSAYLVKKRINLRPIDYENLITDMLVERDYIEKVAELCTGNSEVLECLLVSQIDSDEGVLIVPGENGNVRFAAYYEE
ncbi:MAG: hypothetical protein GXY26_00330 [Clostridiales bacterium]|jgi:hypothetical protein|nr:hypothetical protein [Clostridiales bacterium]